MLLLALVSLRVDVEDVILSCHVSSPLRTALLGK